MDRPTSPMTAERWMQLKEIFAAVQGKLPAEQAEMVRALAQGDEEIESAVRDLLAADESAGSFLQTPAADLHSALLAPGTRLGPYQILGVLGEGGMGKVYRGLDTRLNRAVAIKISAEQFSKRFEQEARAISALNHPNICTLYDVGPNYLVTELVEGETLRDWLEHTPALERRLEAMRQVLEALRALHCAADRASRPAAKHHGSFRWICEGSGLRSGQAVTHRTFGVTGNHRTIGCKCSRSDRGDRRLHVSGADPGASRRSAQRLILHRDHSLRDVDRATPLAARIDRGYSACHPS